MSDFLVMVFILGLPLWAMLGVWLIERKRPPSDFDGLF